MTPVRCNSFISSVAPFCTVLIVVLLVSALSGCSTYIASKQDDLLVQIDVWSAEKEFAKAFETLDYVKTTHPQYNDLQARRKSLLTEAKEFELKVQKQTEKLTQAQQWADALDLIDKAKKKYPQGKIIQKTEQLFLKNQAKKLAEIDQKIMLERSQWMIKTRPIYQIKLNADPRNEELKKLLDSLNAEAETLAQKLTLLAKQAVEKKHFKTARVRIVQAIELKPDKERNKILSSLKNREKITHKKKQQAQKRTRKKKQNSILIDIEKSFRAGELLKSRQLIYSLDEKERDNPELMQLEQELDRSINYTIQHYFSDANRLYTEGEFQQAIAIWQQVLQYDPENKTALKNIQRAEKVIEKLSTLREKQKN